MLCTPYPKQNNNNNKLTGWTNSLENSSLFPGTFKSIRLVTTLVQNNATVTFWVIIPEVDQNMSVFSNYSIAVPRGSIKFSLLVRTDCLMIEKQLSNFFSIFFLLLTFTLG